MRTDLYPSRVEASPRWIPRRDPVVYTSWSDEARPSGTQHKAGPSAAQHKAGPSGAPHGAALCAAQREAFERDGFVVLHDVFADSEIRLLQEELERLRRDPSGLDPETLIAEPGDRSLRSIFAIHRQSPLFSRLAADARLVSIAQHLLADDVYVHQSRLNYKPGFTGKEFYWHSDFETWHVEDGMPRMRAVSVSLLLTENRAVNGPLLLLPGSHRHYVACVGETPPEHYKHSLRRQEYGVPDDESLRRLAEAGIAEASGPAGSVLVFDCNTMHGSNGNITPLPRANAFLVYNAVSNALEAPFGGLPPRPEFIATRREVRAIHPVESGPIRSGPISSGPLHRGPLESELVHGQPAQGQIGGAGRAKAGPTGKAVTAAA